MNSTRALLLPLGFSMALASAISAPAFAEDVPAAYQWKVKSTSWSQTDEARYAEFISILGQAVKERKCWNVDNCLKSKVANPFYHASNPKKIEFYADCADLPHVLRAYFAWKNNLPFTYATGLKPRPGPSGDVRYSRNGNSVVSRRDVVQKSSDEPLDVRAVLDDVRYSIYSGHFRVFQKPEDKGLPDFYPAKVSPGSIKPGTVLYDPNGHVAVVYEVTKNGRILFIDAHPDNSLTQGTYGKRFTQRSRPNSAPGFKNWRAITLSGAKTDQNGNFIGGKMSVATNDQIKDYSTEQFFGTETPKPEKWSKRKFKVLGRKVGWYDFVRTRLAGKELRYKPVSEFTYMIDGLCNDLIYRADAVDIAIKDGLHQKSQPSRLPKNIYGTTGEWEIYSTPSRDARLKTSFKELRDTAKRFLKLHRKRDRLLDYRGKHLKKDLLAAYKSATAACTIEYTNTDGKVIKLSYQDIADRLFRLSFDPYHCIERRWGAASGDELASCPDGKVKQAWYAAEQRLRNQIDRKYDARMDFDLSGLKKGGRGTGVRKPPDIDVLKLLGGRPGA